MKGWGMSLLNQVRDDELGWYGMNTKGMRDKGLEAQNIYGVSIYNITLLDWFITSPAMGN